MASELPPRLHWLAYWINLRPTFLQCLNVKTFLPVIDVVNLLINAIEHNIAFKQEKWYTKISGESAATKFVVDLHQVEDSILEIQHLKG